MQTFSGYKMPKIFWLKITICRRNFMTRGFLSLNIEGTEKIDESQEFFTLRFVSLYENNLFYIYSGWLGFDFLSIYPLKVQMKIARFISYRIKKRCIFLSSFKIVRHFHISPKALHRESAKFHNLLSAIIFSLSAFTRWKISTETTLSTLN